ncbi:MAG: hypothetical protein ING52_10925 [Burkholderiales bacterium]|nr:hypothetical protein [Burkholderiales bacterium]
MDAMPCADRRPALWSRCASCRRRFALAPEASLCQSCADEADVLRRLEEESPMGDADVQHFAFALCGRQLQHRLRGAAAVVARVPGITPVALLVDLQHHNEASRISDCVKTAIPLVTQRLIAPMGLEPRRVLWVEANGDGQFDRLGPNWTDARAFGVPVGWAPLAAVRRSLGAFLDLGPAARLAWLRAAQVLPTDLLFGREPALPHAA